MSQGPITVWLEKWRAGDPEALDQMSPLVDRELHDVARRCLRGESPARTPSVTAPVHEAYLRLLARRQLSAINRADFFSIAARTTRRVLVDHPRGRLPKKRGGDRPVGLDDALVQLAGRSERAVRVVECRVFAELTRDGTAGALGLSRRSVQRTWTTAAAWLREELGRPEGP